MEAALSARNDSWSAIENVPSVGVEMAAARSCFGPQFEQFVG